MTVTFRLRFGTHPGQSLWQVMRRTSICGLGQVALGPVMSVLRLAEDHG